MQSLLIVESPAKCAKIQGFLGPGWKVLATMGHIRALEENLDAIGLTRDFEPRFQFIKDKAKAIAAIKAAAKGAKVYLAADDDREGEAIAYSVMCLLGLPATTPRPVFREITRDAVLNAVANPRQIDMNRVFAQQARAVLDMMVGFTISPLLWKYVGPALSAGRCQTPALRLLADKEQEIAAFSAETTWRIKGSWVGPGAPFEATCADELEDEESATNYLENIHANAEGRITQALTKPYTESAPSPLITSTLQQEASAAMGVQPKNTMRVAQRLYEAGHITYMRTDCPVLSEEAKVAAAAQVTKEYGENFLAAVRPQATRTTKPATTAQEAHEAIRPTHFDRTELPPDEDWNAMDRKIYALIWRRAIQSIMAAAKGERRAVSFVAVGDDSLEWRATAARELFAGWRLAGAAPVKLDEEEPEQQSPWAALEVLEPGAIIRWKSLEAAPYTTKAKGRYTEATLVRELERKGIGRPSTFATLVSTVIDKAYAEKREVPAKEVQVPRLLMAKPGLWPPSRLYEMKKMGAEKNKMAPTALGLSVLEFCLREFGPLFAYEFTATMETRLDAVVAGAPWKQLCRDTWESYRARYEELKAGESTALQPARSRLFGDIKAVQSKKGPLLLKEGATPADTIFFGWPEGKSFGSITEADVVAFVAASTKAKTVETIGTYNEQPIFKKAGPYGPYAQCGDVKIPLKEDATEETLRVAFASRGALHTLGPFEFRTGPYGVYMFKSGATGKARKFVSVPSGVDPKAFTLEAATRIYQTGLQTKAKGSAYRQVPKLSTPDGRT